MKNRFLLALVVVALAAGLEAQQISKAFTGNVNAPDVRSSNLGPLSFEYHARGVTLNNIQLAKVEHSSLDLVSEDKQYKVRANFMQTILFSGHQPKDKKLYEKCSSQVYGGLDRFLGNDLTATLKLVIYKALKPGNSEDLKLAEEIAYLWDASWDTNPKLMKEKKGLIEVRPPNSFVDGTVPDIQYRGYPFETPGFAARAILQILSVFDKERQHTLGAFVVVLKPSGEHEFYQVPLDLLNTIKVKPAATTLAAN